MRPPEFGDLVPDDVQGEERERLRRTHELLVVAGPAPELTPRVAVPPGEPPPEDVRVLPRGIPRRRVAATLVLAAALTLASFGVGYLVGEGSEQATFRDDFSLTMQGTDVAPRAVASLVVHERDEAGNWPMTMTIQGLEPLPEGQRYELLLTRDGEPVVSCGTFRVNPEGRTVVPLNAPYRLRRYDGWVITRAGAAEILLRTEEV